MRLNEAELKHIVKRSTSLRDLIKRLPPGNLTGEQCLEAANTITKNRIQKWKENSANGDDLLFRKRLEIEGLTIASAIDALEQEVTSNEIQLPPWTETLNEIISTLVGGSPNVGINSCFDECSFLRAEKPLPFEELYLPVIFLARHKLREKVGSKYQQFSKSAHDALERTLLERLTELGAQVLLVEFNAHLALLQLDGVDPTDPTKDKTTNAYYSAFIADLKNGQLTELLGEYSMLARFMVTLFDQWIATSALLINRLDDDKLLLERKFNSSNLRQVVRLDSNLSDPHHNGQTVCILTFESGFKVVYKPRSLGLEEKYFELIKWVNRQVFTKLRTPGVINCVHYGWTEFVDHSDMDHSAQIERYYVRSGMLLGLIYLFGGVDFHEENIIANGEYPVLVDLETFIHPELRCPDAIKNLVSAADQMLHDSVMKSHYLPNVEIVNGQLSDYAALGVVDTSKRRRLVWRNLNTDAMQYVHDDVVYRSRKRNRPIYKGSYPSPDGYLNEIVQGFTEIYQVFSKLNQDQLPPEILDIFGQNVRFIYRCTESYSVMFERLFCPEAMVSGIDFDIELDLLSQSLLTAKAEPTLWKFLGSEVKMMWNLDVPYFATIGNTDSIAMSSEPAGLKCFDGAPLERFRIRLLGLNSKDLSSQELLIRTSLLGQTKQKPLVDKNRVSNVSSTTLDKKTMLHVASLIADEIKQNAIYNELGEPSWIVVKGVDYEKKVMIEGIRHGLYDGALGIAIFFAALNKILPEEKNKNFSNATIALTTRWINTIGEEAIFRKIGIGGASGIGSVIYSYTVLSRLLDDDDLLNQAKLTASFVTKEHINSDKSFDIIDGCSGLLLGLLALYNSTKDKTILEKACWCGEHLLINRVATSGGIMAWPNSASKPSLTGFSHGTAGIAYALAKLYEVSPEGKLLEAVLGAIAYESSKFDQSHQNWLDFRFHNDPDATFPFFTTAWCNGAPGIGLSRIGMIGTLNPEKVRGDIEAAMQTTRNAPFHQFDHLCCGNSGRAEVLLDASLKMSKPIWKEEALAITTEIIRKSAGEKGFKPSFNYPLFNPTLFKGYAGLGYHLLRLADTGALPCVLLYET